MYKLTYPETPGEMLPIEMAMDTGRTLQLQEPATQMKKENKKGNLVQAFRTRISRNYRTRN